MNKLHEAIKDENFLSFNQISTDILTDTIIKQKRFLDNYNPNKPNDLNFTITIN
jgi:hypothetical protein